MSSRCYPIFIKGNPQLRVFLPNFWMKLAKPRHVSFPPSTIPFMVSMEMTKFDVKNYLEKIYKIPVKEVRMNIYQGKFKREEIRGYIMKEEDQKWAFVVLPEGAKFIYPNLFPDETKEKELKELKTEMEGYNQFMEKKEQNAARLPGVPMWFGR